MINDFLDWQNLSEKASLDGVPFGHINVLLLKQPKREGGNLVKESKNFIRKKVDTLNKLKDEEVDKQKAAELLKKASKLLDEIVKKEREK